MTSFFLLLRQEFANTKIILDEVLQRVARIEQPNQSLQIDTITTTNQFDDDKELDDYRHLPIVPDARELLSGERPVLQKNIIDGVYNNPQHYLDVSILSFCFSFERFSLRLLWLNSLSI